MVCTTETKADGARWGSPQDDKIHIIYQGSWLALKENMANRDGKEGSLGEQCVTWIVAALHGR